MSSRNLWFSSFGRNCSRCSCCTKYWRAWHTDDPQDFPFCRSCIHEHYSGSS
jgi:hypothetical protein